MHFSIFILFKGALEMKQTWTEITKGPPGEMLDMYEQIVSIDSSNKIKSYMLRHTRCLNVFIQF